MTNQAIYIFGFLACFFGIFVTFRYKFWIEMSIFSFLFGINLMIVYHNYNMALEREKNNEIMKGYQLFREEFERNLENERI